MRNVVCLIVFWMLAVHQPVLAAESMPAARVEGVPLRVIIETVSERLHKNFIVDPRVNASVEVVGIDLKRISYEEFQAILEVHGFTTVEDGKLTKIVPDANARQYPMRILGDRTADISNDEFVTKVLDVAPLNATQLVPILRPLMPQYAHMVGSAQGNTLIVVGRYANVKQIESIVRELQKRPTAPE